MLFHRVAARRCLFLAGFAGIAVAVLGLGAAPARAQITPQTVALIDGLCAQTLRANEEDRLYGMISLAVRGTMRYRGAAFRSDLIDTAVQDALDGLIEDCPELTEADASKRLDMAITMVADATTRVLAGGRTIPKPSEAESGKEGKNSLLRRKPKEKSTAADLSQELSSQEIDQWINGLPPRQRALTMFLYASDVTPKEIAEAVGEPPGVLTRQFAASKADLMHVLQEEWSETAAVPAAARGGGPAMSYAVSGEGFATLMRASGPAPPASAPAAPPADPAAPAAADPAANTPPPADESPARRKAGDNILPALRVTGISNDLYAGWSLLATARNLPRGQRVGIGQPFLVEPDRAGIRRMLVTDIVEIGDPNAPVRRFLLKAFAIDAEGQAAGLRDSFHVGAPVDNAEAKKTLANASLASIEVARCLWHDFGTGQDPGLCRD